MTVPIVYWQYWAPSVAIKNYIENVPKARLIKFSQGGQSLRIRGISTDKIVDAFGTPTNTYIKNEFELWEYHPWNDEKDWILPVYLKNNVLWSVGDNMLFSVDSL